MINRLRVIQTAFAKNVSFRSFSEVERALDSIRNALNMADNELKVLEFAVTVNILDGKKLKLKKSVNQPGIKLLKAPDVDKIKKNFTAIADLDDKIKTLDTIEAELAYQFKGERGHQAALKEVRALRKLASEKIQQAYNAINKIAKGNVRPNFEQFVEECVETILENLEGFYDRSSQRLFIDAEEKSLRFTHYLRFENLVDNTGFVYKEYNVTFTHIWDADHDSIYVNTMQTFRVPGRFNKGILVSGSDGAVDIIDQMLVSESFKSIIEGADIPLSQKDVPTGKFNHVARSVKVTDTSVDFVIKPGISPDKAVQDLFLLMKGLLASKLKNNATTLKYKLSKDNKKVQFYISNNREMKLNRSQLKLLQREFGLSDDEIKRIYQEVL